MVISTYQSASGAGKDGLIELDNQLLEYSREKDIQQIFLGNI